MVLITLHEECCANMAWLCGCFLHHLAAVFFFLYWSLKEAIVEVHSQRREVMFHLHRNGLNNKLLRRIYCIY